MNVQGKQGLLYMPQISLGLLKIIAEKIKELGVLL
jgi:hypothetical protein